MILFLNCTNIERKEQYSVYNDTFLELYGTEGYHVPFIDIFKLDSISRDSLWNDFIHAKNRPIDNRRLLIGIGDSLSFPDNYKEAYKRQYGFLNGIDSILVTRPYEINKNTELIDLNRLTNTGKYELMTLSRIQELGIGKYFRKNLDSIYGQSILILSKVIFDDSLKYGCFTYEKVDNGGHGHGLETVYVEKRGDKWFLIKK